MELTYLAADFETARIFERALPLENVSLQSSFDGGRFTADLDLRKAVDIDDYAGARDISAMIWAGSSTILPVRENLRAGDGRTADVAMGEWLITNVERSHASPILKLSGVEPHAYARQNVVTRTWKSKSADPVGTARQMIDDLFHSGQRIVMDAQNWNGQKAARVPLDVQAGTTTYWDAITDLQGDGVFEWMIYSAIDDDQQTVTRRLSMGEPRIEIKRDDVVLEAVTPGSRPTVLLDVQDDDPIDAYCNDLWAFGSGAGKDQRKKRITRNRTLRQVRQSRTLTASDALTQGQLDRVAARAMGRMHPDYRPFQVTASMDMLAGGGERIGMVHPFMREASLSMPTPESRDVRVVAWEWRQPKPGEQETATLTLERLY